VLSRIKKLLSGPVGQRLLGIGMAIVAGVLYGVNLVPFSLWRNSLVAKHQDPGPLDYAFSTYIQIAYF
jgi:hypothetical protein